MGRRARHEAKPHVAHAGIAVPDPAPSAGWKVAALGLLLVTLVVKVVVLAQLHDHPLLQPAGELDSAVYARLAQRAAAGDWALGPDAYYVSPLYVYFLAIVLNLGGGALLAARTLQILLGVAAVGLVHATARRLFGEVSGLVAGSLAALTGVLTFNEVLILQSSVDPFLTALALWLLARALGSGRPADLALAGLAQGLFALNRPNALAWSLALLAGLLIARRLRQGTIEAAALALGLSLALAPVAIRNRVVAGEWVLLASHGGLNFFVGNNAEADGTYHSVPGITPSIEGQARDARRVAEQDLGVSLTASEVSGHFYRKAFDWIRAEPGAALRLFLRKLAYVFNALDLSLNYSYAYYASDERTLLRVLFVGPGLLVPLGLLGLLAAPRRPPLPDFALWALFVPAYALSVATFFVASRYRMPLLLPLATTAGAGFVALVEAARSRTWPRLATLGAAAALLAAPAVWRFPLDDGRSAERTEMIVFLVDNRRDGEARALLARTEPVHLERAQLLYRVGAAYSERGDFAASLPLFERAHAASPEQPLVRLALGQALLESRRVEEALPHLRAAVEANARKDIAGFELARALASLGRRDEALAALRETPPAQERSGRSAMVVGLLAQQLGDPALAAEHFTLAVAQAPRVGDAHERLGLSLAQLGRAADAARHLEEACRLDPRNASARLNLAVLQAQAGRFAEARARAEEALRIRPDYPQARGLLQELARVR